MAYLRLTEDCKVYFYEHADGGWDCCGCLFAEDDDALVKHFVDMTDALTHLYDHCTAGHVSLSRVDHAAHQLTGHCPIEPDPVIAEMVTHIIKQGGGRIASDDAAVPAEFRLTTEELILTIIDDAREAGDSQTAADAMDALAKIRGQR